MNNHKWKMREAIFFILLLSLQYLNTSAKLITEHHQQHYHHLDDVFVCRADRAVCHISQQQQQKDVTSLAKNEEHTREKRAVILTTLFVISVFASVANLGFDIYLSIKGCEGIFPSMKGYNKEIVDIRDKLTDLSDKSNDEYTKSQNLLEYLKTTNKQNQDIWFHVHRIMELTRMVFEELNPTLLQSFMSRSHDLRKELMKRNETMRGMDFTALTAKYQGIFSSTKSLLIGITPVVSELGYLAISKGYSWYKAHKIAQIASKSGAVAGPKTAAQVLARTSSVSSKAVQTTSKMATFMKGAGGLMSVVAIGFEIWSAVMKVKGCQQQRDQLKKAIDKLKPEVPKFQKTYKDVKVHLSKMEVEYAKVKSQITSKIFFEYLSNVTLIATSGHSIYQKASNDVKEFESKIKKANRQQTVELQAKLLAALQKYTFTWSCLETQVRIVTYTRDSCAKGRGDMRTLYDQAVRNFKRVDDCTLTTGEKYTTFEKTEIFVRQQMKDMNVKEDCLLNNDIVIQLTCKLHAKRFDTAYIVGKTGLTAQQVTTVTAACPPEELPPTMKGFICQLKGYGQTLAFVLDFYKKFDQKQVAATYNACPAPRTAPSSRRRRDVLSMMSPATRLF